MTKKEINEMAASEYPYITSRDNSLMKTIMSARMSYVVGAEMVNSKQPYTAEDMYTNMQYYMEYCQMEGYVTPMDWLKNHKHF